MLDVISGGRIVSGFVRGIGIESWANNTNPVHNRERFEECHDLVIKTWTTPGPANRSLPVFWVPMRDRRRMPTDWKHSPPGSRAGISRDAIWWSYPYPSFSLSCTEASS